MGRWMKLVTVLAIDLTACGQAHSTPSPRTPAPDDVLYVSTRSGLELVSAAGRPVLELPGGVASPAHEVLVSTESHDGTTLVRRVDSEGTELTEWTIDGDVRASVISPLGTQVALTEGSDRDASPYSPVARRTTRVVIADVNETTEEFDLGGNFEPEAFSTDGRELFLLEYMPEMAPTRYRVRRLLLSKGRVAPIGRLKTAAPDQMQGTGRAQVYSPWGDELYTLYTQQDSAGHEGGAFSGDHAFVHLLNLEGSWTHCIDLPHTFGHGDATASALAVSPDGQQLFVVDWSHGIVAVARPEKVKVIDTATVDFGEDDDQTYAAATEDRLYVGGGAEVVVLDSETLELLDRWSMPAEVTGLAISYDGERLYVSSSEGVTAIDAIDGKTILETAIEGAEGLAHAAPAP